MVLALNLDSLTGGFISGTTRNTGQTITGQEVLQSDKGAQQNLFNFQDFLSGGRNNPQSASQNINTNLLNLGQASRDLSKGLNQQIEIRETQRAETFGAINSLANITGEINQRLSSQVTALGQSQSQGSSSQGEENILGKFGADIQELFTGNRDFLANPFGSTALLVGGGIVLFLLLRR